MEANWRNGEGNVEEMLRNCEGMVVIGQRKCLGMVKGEERGKGGKVIE